MHAPIVKVSVTTLEQHIFACIAGHMVLTLTCPVERIETHQKAVLLGESLCQLLECDMPLLCCIQVHAGCHCPKVSAQRTESCMKTICS